MLRFNCPSTILIEHYFLSFKKVKKKKRIYFYQAGKFDVDNFPKYDKPGTNYNIHNTLYLPE